MEEPQATLYFLIIGRIVKIQYQCDENICLCVQVQSYIHNVDKSTVWFVNYYMLCSNNSKDVFSSERKTRGRESRDGAGKGGKS